MLWQELLARSLKLIYTHFRTFVCRDTLPEWMMCPEVTSKLNSQVNSAC